MKITKKCHPKLDFIEISVYFQIWTFLNFRAKTIFADFSTLFSYFVLIRNLIGLKGISFCLLIFDVMHVTPSQIICGVHLIKSKSIWSPRMIIMVLATTGAAITAIPPLYFVLLQLPDEDLVKAKPASYYCDVSCKCNCCVTLPLQTCHFVVFLGRRRG